MAFLALVLIGWLLYFRGYKVSALLVLFFFITDGFNIVPEEAMETGIGFSKGMDFAFIQLMGFLGMDALCKKNYFRLNFFVKILIAFYLFLFISILYSKFALGLTWSDVIRCTRGYFLFLAYFIFRDLKKKDLDVLLDILFYITVVLSVLFLCQIVIDEFILNEAGKSTALFMGKSIPRYYNQPFLINFYIFYVLYKCPARGLFRWACSLILAAAYFGAFHRNLLIGFVLAILLGYFIRLTYSNRMRILVVGAAVVIPFLMIKGHEFMKSRTFIDLSSVLSGEFLDTDIDLNDLQNSTFTFRMGHMFERMSYLHEHPGNILWGAGLITEDSPVAKKKFDFQIGLVEELTQETVQLDTSDISYSVLFIRFGYLGTLIFMTMFISLMVFFFKNKKNNDAYIGFIYLVLCMVVSFFSDNLLKPHTLVMALLLFALVEKENELFEK